MFDKIIFYMLLQVVVAAAGGVGVGLEAGRETVIVIYLPKICTIIPVTQNPST